MNWKLKIGNLLFKYRSFTPLPFIALVFLVFKPGNWGETHSFINVVGLLIALMGESIRILTVGFTFSGTSGRESFLRADNLNVSGIYSIIRNPLYCENFLIFTGIVVVFANFFALLLFVLFLLGQYYLVILAEENYLKQKYPTEYHTYCSQVKRIFPTFARYIPNQNPFNLKKVLFKENDSIFNLLVMYLIVLAYKEKLLTGRIHSLWIYGTILVVLIVLYGIVKILKKRN